MRLRLGNRDGECHSDAAALAPVTAMAKSTVRVGTQVNVKALAGLGAQAMAQVEVGGGD